ncbi:MAG: alpha/beta hydrolase [Sediminibacterium sp.]
MAKQGFSERLYLKYLRTKFKTLAIVSPQKAAEIAFDLFCTPYPKYKKTKAPAIFHQAQKKSLVLKEGIEIKGFEWQPTQPNGKTVLIAHGYASFFFKFEQYIQPLLKEGFRVIGFDAPGHGRSQGKYINVLIYRDAIHAIMEAFGPIDHFIGHSLGGLTLSLVAETIDAPETHKFVLIAPATKTSTTFEGFFSLMRFSPELKKAFYDLVESKAGKHISYFEADRAIANFKGKVLWAHDQDDPVCPYKDLENFKNKGSENTTFLITNELGHNKIYKTQAVIDKIVSFLAS